MKKEDFTRRSFIRNSALAGLGAITLGTVAGCSSTAIGGSGRDSQEPNISGLAGLSLRELHDRFHKELFDRFLPAMDKYSIDHEYGGFMCDFNISSRELISSTKRTWYQGRGIWVYSFLYNNFKSDPGYLEIARKAIDFMLKLRPKDNGFWEMNFTREGGSVSEPGDIYGDLFVAEGLAEYSKASGDKQYLQIAKDIIFNCLDRYDQPDYVYDISYAPGRPEIKGPRVLGHWMLFLSLSTQILSQGPDTDFEALADRSIEAILKYHMNEEYQILNEVINHDLSLPENEFSDFSVIGHGIETLAFVMAEAVRRKDAGLFNISKNAFKRHVEVAADKLYGGYFEVLYNANSYTWSPSKSTWCQQEVSIGTLLMIEHVGAQWEQDCFSELDAYMQEKMVRPDFAFWTFGGGRKVDKPSLTTLEHYHTPRYLMRSLLALQRIMDRNGNVSDLLA